MMTDTSQLMYKHPNVLVSHVDFVIDYGWYKHFRTIVHSNSLSIQKIKYPSNLHVRGNIQATLFRRWIDTIASEFKGAISQMSPVLCQPDFHTSFTKPNVVRRVVNSVQAVSKKHKQLNDKFKLLISGAYVSAQNTAWYTKYAKNVVEWIFGNEITDEMAVIDNVMASTHLTQAEDATIRYGGIPVMKYKQIDGLDDYNYVASGNASKEIKMELKQHLKSMRSKRSVKQDAYKFASLVKDYYHEKPLTVDMIQPPANEIIQPGAIFQMHENTKAVHKYLAEQQDNFEVKDKDLVPSGYTPFVNGADIQEIEWSSKSYINQICGLYTRQMACRTKINDEDYKRFENMTKRFWGWYSSELNKIEFDHEYDLFEALDSKTFPPDKKAKYLDTLLKQKHGVLTRYLGAFTVMVKKGEVYQTNSLDYNSKNQLMNQESRPRIISKPDPVGCGTLTLIQGSMWPTIKKIIPGFIQGYTKEQMQVLFRSKVTTNMHSISIDGSAYDSSQKASLMKLVDTPLFEIYKPHLQKVLEYNQFHRPDIAIKHLHRAATTTDFNLFSRIPGVNGPQMTTSQISQLRGIHPYLTNSQIRKDWLCYPLSGTTLSGHSTKTTLGNTFRSLMYAYYYLEQAGVSEPWKESAEHFVAASGDDVVFWVSPRISNSVQKSILANTLRSKNDTQPTGLGQVVESLTVGRYWEIDF